MEGEVSSKKASPPSSQQYISVTTPLLDLEKVSPLISFTYFSCLLLFGATWV